MGAFRPTGGAVVDEATISRMCDAMAHRGPDGRGTWRSKDGACAFGHRRLSIIDLSDAASQPMVNRSGDVVVVFNGEIYNHAELRRELEQLGRRTWQTDHSDTEVLLQAFEEWGMDCLHRLYGMFALVIYDGRVPGRPVLHMARDRMGIKPLYLSRTPMGEWLFASEIRALLEHPQLEAEIDLTAFWHYLTFIVAPAPLTMFRGIFKLPAGHRIEVDHNGRARALRWYDCRPSRDKTLTEDDLSFDEAVEELTNRLRTSIARRMVSDVPFGVLLSGGVDSSLNVALMSELMDRPVSTFTIGYEGHEANNEFDQARRVVERFGTEHHERRITTAEALAFLPELVRLQDEPIADNVCIPLYFLAELVRKSNTTVVQVGEGADEHFLGYWWCEHYRDLYERVYRPALAGRRVPGWRKLLARAPSRVAAGSAEEVEVAERARRGQALFWGGAACFWGPVRDRLTPNPSAFEQSVDCPVEGLLPPSFAQTDSHAVVAHYRAELDELVEPSVLQEIPFLEGRLRLPEHLLMRVDKMTMAHSIEARVPFLDHDVVEFANRLPLSYKLDDGQGKRVVKAAAEPFLDRETIYRPKQGFGAPMDQWFADEQFGKRCLDTYTNSWIGKSGLLDSGFVVDLLQRQMSGGGGHGFHLWTIMNAVLWHEVWVEGTLPWG